MFKYEHSSRPLAPRRIFYKRLAAHFFIGQAIILVSLAIGTVLYHSLADLSWVDALLNASMIMGGMGPVDPLHTNGAKIFASIYALYSGCVLLISVGVLFAPVVHRILHGLHIATQDDK